jgi:parallel beta-helix repeat protein
MVSTVRLAGALALALCITALGAGTARAFSSGITTTTFGNTGCPLCHSGGTVPSVSLTGPTVVDPGSTNEYTLTITSVPAQTHAGLNVSAPEGVLSVGGGASANTQTLPGPGPENLAEITHTAPKPTVWDIVSFSFQWTAPVSFTSVTLSAWGNAVNLNFSATGDAAANDTLEIFASDADTPTPTNSPTPTATPVGCMGDEEPLKPYLVADEAAQKCQEAIAKGGRVYIKKDLKATQKCLNNVQKGTVIGDPATLCIGDADTLPTDAISNAKIADAQGKLSAALTAKCTDATVAPLRLCATTVAGLQTCLTEALRQRVVDAVTAEYGVVAASADGGIRACQKAIAGAGRKFIVAAAGAAQKCLNARNKECLTGNAAARCMGSVVGGSFIPPTDTQTAEKIAKAEDKLRTKILAKCSDAQIAALDTCGSTQASAADCAACAHRSTFFAMMGDEYGGADVFANPAITLQAAVDAAAEGETIMLDPGIYEEAVAITTHGLQLIGQKTCAGDRAILRNTGSAANGIFAANIDGLLFEGFQAEDYEANDIFVSGAEGVTFRDLVTTGPGTATGTEYGVFPILSNNVLIEDCLVVGVRDAGIYVGQSTNIVVRNNEVHGNVAGIEIENSGNAEVYGNYAHDNTGGILVFKLPGLTVQLSNCHDIHDNIVENNNIPNYGGGTVGLVPQGTGILVLSNDASIIRNNQITGNDSLGLAVTDQGILNSVFSPPPFPMTSPDYLVENHAFTGNTITGNGENPDPSLGATVGDTLFFISGGTGSCQSGNTYDTDFANFFTGLPACPMPVVLPGCPVPPLP